MSFKAFKKKTNKQTDLHKGKPDQVFLYLPAVLRISHFSHAIKV